MSLIKIYIDSRDWDVHAAWTFDTKTFEVVIFRWSDIKNRITIKSAPYNPRCAEVREALFNSWGIKNFKFTADFKFENPKIAAWVILWRNADWWARIKQEDGSNLENYKPEWNNNLFEFWSLFNKYVTENNLNILIKKPNNESWYEIWRLSPSSELYIERLSRTNTIRVSLWIKKDLNTFDKLYVLKDDIERDLWYNLTRERFHWTWSSSIIYYEIPWIYFNDKENYLKQIELATTFALKLKSIILKYI